QGDVRVALWILASSELCGGSPSALSEAKAKLLAWGGAWFAPEQRHSSWHGPGSFWPFQSRVRSHKAGPRAGRTMGDHWRHRGHLHCFISKSGDGDDANLCHG